MRNLFALAASTLLLAACGGGGGGGSPDFVVDGTAAKGRIHNATVEARTVTSSGVESTTVLGSATTVNGTYKLRFAGPPSQPYVIRVIANAGTTHDDEVRGSQPLPAGFTMRAAVVPPSVGNIVVNVTPFTEMAVTAAENAGGGISVANVQQANLTVGSLLGLDSAHDLPSIEPKTTSDASTPDEQRLAVMLAAVSVISDTGAIAACGANNVACVVDTLASNTQTSTMALGPMAPILADAVQAVVDDDDLRGDVPPSVVQSNNIECSSNCGSPTPVNDTVGDAIAATKALFTELRSDIFTLFGDPVGSSTGDLITQGDQFQAAMKGVQAPADMVVRDTALIQMGIQLYNEAKAGSTTMFSSREPDVFGTDTTSGSLARCRLFQDSGLTSNATSGSNASFIGCATPYYFETANNVEYIHGITLTPAGSGVFTYTSVGRARNASTLATVSRTGLPTPSGGSASGTVTATFNTDGQLTNWTTTGTLPGAFKMGTPTVVSDRNAWTVNATRALTGSVTTSVSLSGTVTSLDAAGTTLGTLVVKTGSYTAAADGNITSAALDVQWTRPNVGSTAGAEFEGTLSAASFLNDASGTGRSPTQVTLAGRLATITSSATTNFLSGTATASITGYGSFNETKPVSSTNTFTVNASFSGSVTAPGRPQLLVTVASSKAGHDDNPGSATVQYRSMSGSTTRMAINVSVTRDTSNNLSLAVTETTHGLSTTITRTGQHDVLSGSTRIGVYDSDTRTLTFSDGSGISSI
jgi:hypothetical protein